MRVLCFLNYETVIMFSPHLLLFPKRKNRHTVTESVLIFSWEHLIPKIVFNFNLISCYLDQSTIHNIISLVYYFYFKFTEVLKEHSTPTFKPNRSVQSV